MSYNLGDERSIKEKGKLSRKERRDEILDLQSVLASSAGRRVMWRMLERAKVFGSVWEPSAKIHYNAGVQDFGHYIMGEISEADMDAFFLMMKENKEKGEEHE